MMSMRWLKWDTRIAIIYYILRNLSQHVFQRARCLFIKNRYQPVLSLGRVHNYKQNGIFNSAFFFFAIAQRARVRENDTCEVA